MTKLWSGRFQKGTDLLVEDFHSSIRFDQRLYRQDIQGSIAHARMLGATGILPTEEAKILGEGLKDLLKDIEAGKVTFTQEAEDIHMNIESLLTERIGPLGKKLHTGRSRNDQVATDLRLYVKEEGKVLTALLLSLERVLLDLAKEHHGAVMPGYTHLQKAQPVTFGHHMMAYFEMLCRDIGRLEDLLVRMDELPLGAGALAGTPYPLDRAMVAKELGFSRLCQNSLDAVSDRDYVIELESACSILMMHFSRLCEELILWSSDEFRFIVLDDAFATGSSIMPQKKNPDVAELIRGKSGRVFGHLLATLSMMKSLPLAYNKDMQEDKEALFDTLDTVKKSLLTLTPMLKTLTVQTAVLRESAKGGFTNATDVADYLVGKGLPFREAHGIVGQLVFYCMEKDTVLEALPLDTLRDFSSVFEEDLFAALDLDTALSKRNLPGGPAKERVLEAVAKGEAWVKAMEEKIL